MPLCDESRGGLFQIAFIWYICSEFKYQIRYGQGNTRAFALREEELLFRVCFRHLRHPPGGGGGDNQEQPVACRIEGRERQNHEAGDDYTIAPDSRL